MPTPAKFNPHGHRPRVGPVVLPAAGRQGPPPPWPASGRQTAAERAAWADLWHTPQAVAWEQGATFTREVARYTRLLVQSEKAGATAAVHAQATACADRLGLTPKSMRLLLWSVAGPAPGEDASTPLGRVLSAQRLRQRMRADGEDLADMEDLRARLRPMAVDEDEVSSNGDGLDAS